MSVKRISVVIHMLRIMGMVVVYLKMLMSSEKLLLAEVMIDDSFSS